MRNTGKEAEAEVKKALVLLRKKTKTAFTRLYDTSSTGGLVVLPETPCDFLMCRQGRTFLIEVKSSTVKKKMQTSLYSDQAGHFKIWQRAGATILPLFILLTDNLDATGFQIARWENQEVADIVSGDIESLASMLDWVSLPLLHPDV